MSATLELEIQRLLNDYGDAELAADDLIHRWKRDEFSLPQQYEVAQFLLSSGLHTLLLDQVLFLLELEKPIPWAHLASVMDVLHEDLDSEAQNAFFEGAQAQDAIEELLRSPAIDHWEPVFANRRESHLMRRQLEFAEQKNLLREKLEFFRSQRMFEEEANCLAQLRAMFPEDPELQREHESYQERWAREVIAQSTQMTDLTREMTERAAELTSEQKSIKGRLLKSALDYALEKPTLAYDLTLMLVFMEFYTEALEVLKQHPPARAADWLRLELMLRARQFVSALEEANRLEVLYAGEPESTFAIVYARARALWGLGQGTMAIDLLRSIVNIRPHYKAAHSLLMEWSGGDL